MHAGLGKARSPSFGWGLALVWASALPSVAVAQPTICEITSVDPAMDLVELTCAPPIVCAGADGCASSGFTDPVCGSAITDLPTICRPRCGTLIGCTIDADCRPFRDVMGHCNTTTSATGGRDGICAYPGLGFSYCTTGGSLDPMMLAHCHTRTDGAVTQNYLEGNCDEDACPNGADPNPCLFTEETECMPLDLSIACSTLPFDAGVAPIDAGPPADRDAGPRLDAGTDPPFDAATLPAASFGGGGGVRCAVSAGSSPASGLLPALVVLMIAFRRQRHPVD